MQLLAIPHDYRTFRLALPSAWDCMLGIAAHTLPYSWRNMPVESSVFGKFLWVEPCMGSLYMSILMFPEVGLPQILSNFHPSYVRISTIKHLFWGTPWLWKPPYPGRLSRSVSRYALPLLEGSQLWLHPDCPRLWALWAAEVMSGDISVCHSGYIMVYQYIPTAVTGGELTTISELSQTLHQDGLTGLWSPCGMKTPFSLGGLVWRHSDSNPSFVVMLGWLKLVSKTILLRFISLSSFLKNYNLVHQAFLEQTKNLECLLVSESHVS